MPSRLGQYIDKPALKIENLSVSYELGSCSVTALDDISISLSKNMSLGIAGESGSGKTTLAMAVMGLLNQSTSAHGKICFNDINLQLLSEKQRSLYRWSKIAIVFQNSLDVLNPVMSVHEQIYECLIHHTKLTSRQAAEKVGLLLESVGMESAHGKYFPHQLSGGMRQRILLAMALSCEPQVLIVDEPTNALDVLSKNDIVNLISKVHKEKEFALIVISHELNTLLKLTSRLAVMYKGRILEEGPTKDVFSNPLHIYTRGLINSSPDINPYRDMWGIPGETELPVNSGCSFFPRCSQAQNTCRITTPSLESILPDRKVACNRKGIVTILKGSGISKQFGLNGKFVHACKNCSIEIRSGETAVLIGESGSGKTTLAKILSGVLDSTTGEILFDEEKIIKNSATNRKNGLQLIFQDPYSSINENFTVEQAIKEPLDILGQDSPAKKTKHLIEVIRAVQLPWDEDFRRRKCHTMSGGQRQRIAIARALIMEPKVLIADEISSMLDPSTQANILRLLKGLQNQTGFAMLYVTHDLPVAQKIADRIYVMHDGEIIEHADAQKIFTNPVHGYTKKLVAQGLIRSEN